MAIRFLNINRENVGKLTDEELVSKFSKTEKDAYFEELYNRYQHLVYGLCLKMMKEESDSIIVFKSRQEKWLDKMVIGREKNKTDNFI